MQAGLFPTVRDPWPPVVTPQFPQNPVVVSSRDPNMEMKVMTYGLAGLAAGSGYRGAVPRMVPSREYHGPLLRGLAAARIISASGQMHRIGRRGGLHGLGDPCTDHTAQDWGTALAAGAQVFQQVTTTTHDAGWTQAGTVASQVGTGISTITSGLCHPTTPAQTFVGSQNDMQNAIANAQNQATPPYAQAGAGSTGYMAPGPKGVNFTPWLIGGGVALAAILAVVLLKR